MTGRTRLEVPVTRSSSDGEIRPVRFDRRSAGKARQHGDPMAHGMARRHASKGLELIDLEQVAGLALLKAMRRLSQRDIAALTMSTQKQVSRSLERIFSALRDRATAQEVA